MTLNDRAAQFAPFSALTGLDETLDEAKQEVEAQDLGRIYVSLL